MKLLLFIRNLKEAVMGEDLRKTFLRNAEAADRLDRAVKEMLEK